MALKTGKASQSVSKGKSASSYSWAFMEEIEAPMWVDLALEGRSNQEDWEDSWFHTVHPFHQRSFHDLVSASPLFVKVKGRVSKSVRVSPTLVNSVSKSRGHPRENHCWLTSKPAQIQLNLSELNKQRNSRTRQSGEKPSSPNSNSNSNEGSATPLHKSGDDSETQVFLHKSSNNIMSKASFTVSAGSGRELKNHIDAQASPSGNVHCESTVSDLKTAMPRTARLLHMLKMSSLRRSTGAHPLRVEVKDEEQPKDRKSSSKMSSLRRSAGAHPLRVEVKVEQQPKDRKSSSKMSSLRRSAGAHPLRVEVKVEQQPKDRKSSSKSSNSVSSTATNRKTSSIGSSNENSDKVRNESNVLKAKTQAEKSTISPKNNRKKSSIGSSSTVEEKTKKDCEAANATDKAERASTEIRTMQGLGASAELGVKQEQLIGGKKGYGVAQTASRRPLQQIDNAGQCQRKNVTFHHQRLIGKENTNLVADQHQKPLTSTKDTAGCQASRRPLQQVSNKGLCPQKSATFCHQRFPGKENAHLGTTQHQKFLTNTKDVTGCQAKLKELAQPKRGSTLHSIKDITKWEKNHGCSYFSLKQSEREKANREIQNSKPCYR